MASRQAQIPYFLVKPVKINPYSVFTAVEKTINYAENSWDQWFIKKKGGGERQSDFVP